MLLLDVSPIVGNLPIRRLTPVLMGQRRLDGVVFLMGHVQNALVCIVYVARPSEDGEECHDGNACDGYLQVKLLHVSCHLSFVSKNVLLYADGMDADTSETLAYEKLSFRSPGRTPLGGTDASGKEIGLADDRSVALALQAFIEDEALVSVAQHLALR